MEAIFRDDQAVRTAGGASIDWNVVGPQDAARRARARALLDAGALRSGDDFYNASVVFQHGTEAADYILAHALTVAAASRGRSDAAWMAAASLHRYLQAVGQPQVYGTQYRTPDRRNTTQEPYAPSLIPDRLRQAVGVATIAEQQVRRREIEARYRAAATK